MNEVKFKTLDAEKVHGKLIVVADRLIVVEKIIDKVLNDTDSSYLLPVVRDAQSELADVYFDMMQWTDDNTLAVIGE